jgi:hypothetical protein
MDTSGLNGPRSPRTSPAPAAGTLVQVCAWCGVRLASSGTGEPVMVSHGICASCAERLVAEVPPAC